MWYIFLFTSQVQALQCCRSLHNQTNEMLSNSDWMKYFEFRDQLFSALKIFYTLISILIITAGQYFGFVGDLER